MKNNISNNQKLLSQVTCWVNEAQKDAAIIGFYQDGRVHDVTSIVDLILKAADRGVDVRACCPAHTSSAQQKTDFPATFATLVTNIVNQLPQGGKIYRAKKSQLFPDSPRFFVRAIHVDDLALFRKMFSEALGLPS